MTTITPAGKVERIGDTLDILGESPVWCGREQVLYRVDIRAPALHRLDPRTGALRTFALNDLCGAVIRSTGRRLVLAMRTGLFVFDPENESLTPLVAPEPETLNNRLNETKCDRLGRLWVGTMRDYGAACTGSLYRVGADLSCERVLGDITIPNAMAWSPDNRTMYFTDTAEGRLRAYEFDASEGRLGAMRIVEGAATLPGHPDGATVDADGCLWNARYQGGCVARITPKGDIDRIIEIPARQVTSCALGGPGLRTLYITTARQRLTAAELEAQPLAGALFAVEVGIGGIAEPEFPLPS
jgi:sugar lactone lactonase YvrE